MQAYRVCHTPITFAVGQQLGLTPDQVAPLSFKVGEVVRIAGDVSRLGQRDLPGPQLEAIPDVVPVSE